MQIKKITAFIVMLAMVLNIMPAFNITISAEETIVEVTYTLGGETVGTKTVEGATVEEFTYSENGKNEIYIVPGMEVSESTTIDLADYVVVNEANENLEDELFKIGDKVYIYSTKVNLIPNADFAHGYLGWYAVGGAAADDNFTIENGAIIPKYDKGVNDPTTLQRAWAIEDGKSYVFTYNQTMTADNKKWQRTVLSNAPDWDKNSNQKGIMGGSTESNVGIVVGTNTVAFTNTENYNYIVLAASYAKGAELSNFGLYELKEVTEADDETVTSVDVIYTTKDGREIKRETVSYVTANYPDGYSYKTSFEYVANGENYFYSAEVDTVLTTEDVTIEMTAEENANAKEAGDEFISGDAVYAYTTGENLIPNATFTDGLEGWYNSAGTAATTGNFTADSSKGTIYVKNSGGSTSERSLYRAWRVEKGEKYVLTFNASASGDYHVVSMKPDMTTTNDGDIVLQVSEKGENFVVFTAMYDYVQINFRWANGVTFGNFGLYKVEQTGTAVTVSYTVDGVTVGEVSKGFGNLEFGAAFEPYYYSANGSNDFYMADAIAEVSENTSVEMKKIDNYSEYSLGDKITIGEEEYVVTGINLVPNSKFENGTIGWYKANGDAADFTTDAASGTITTADGGLWRAWETTIGRTYIIKFTSSEAKESFVVSQKDSIANSTNGTEIATAVAGENMVAFKATEKYVQINFSEMNGVEVGNFGIYEVLPEDNTVTVTYTLKGVAVASVTENYSTYESPEGYTFEHYHYTENGSNVMYFAEDVTTHYDVTIELEAAENWAGKAKGEYFMHESVEPVEEPEEGATDVEEPTEEATEEIPYQIVSGNMVPNGNFEHKLEGWFNEDGTKADCTYTDNGDGTIAADAPLYRAWTVKSGKSYAFVFEAEAGAVTVSFGTEMGTAEAGENMYVFHAYEAGYINVAINANATIGNFGLYEISPATVVTVTYVYDETPNNETDNEKEIVHTVTKSYVGTTGAWVDEFYYSELGSHVMHRVPGQYVTKDIEIDVLQIYAPTGVDKTRVDNWSHDEFSASSIYTDPDTNKSYYVVSKNLVPNANFEHGLATWYTGALTPATEEYFKVNPESGTVTFLTNGAYNTEGGLFEVWQVEPGATYLAVCNASRDCDTGILTFTNTPGDVNYDESDEAYVVGRLKESDEATAVVTVPDGMNYIQLNIGQYEGGEFGNFGLYKVEEITPIDAEPIRTTVIYGNEPILPEYVVPAEGENIVRVKWNTAELNSLAYGDNTIHGLATDGTELEAVVEVYPLSHTLEDQESAGSQESARNDAFEIPLTGKFAAEMDIEVHDNGDLWLIFNTKNGYFGKDQILLGFYFDGEFIVQDGNGSGGREFKSTAVIANDKPYRIFVKGDCETDEFSVTITSPEGYTKTVTGYGFRTNAGNITNLAMLANGGPGSYTTSNIKLYDPDSLTAEFVVEDENGKSVGAENIGDHFYGEEVTILPQAKFYTSYYDEAVKAYAGDSHNVAHIVETTKEQIITITPDMTSEVYIPVYVDIYKENAVLYDTFATNTQTETTVPENLLMVAANGNTDAPDYDADGESVKGGGSAMGGSRIPFLTFNVPEVNEGEVVKLNLYAYQLNGQVTQKNMKLAVNTVDVEVDEKVQYIPANYADTTNLIWSDKMAEWTSQNDGGNRFRVSEDTRRLTFDVTEAVVKAKNEGKDRITFAIYAPTAGAYVMNREATRFNAVHQGDYAGYLEIGTDTYTITVNGASKVTKDGSEVQLDESGSVTVVADTDSNIKLYTENASNVAFIGEGENTKIYKVATETTAEKTTVMRASVGNANAIDDGIYFPVALGADMVDGAQVRIGEGVTETGEISTGSGLRFITVVNASDTLASYALGNSEMKMGVKITAEGSTDDKAVYIPAEKWQTDGGVFTTALTNLAVSNYNRNFTAVPYITCVDADGKKVEFTNAPVTRSIYFVAAGLLKNGYDTDGDEDDSNGVETDKDYADNDGNETSYEEMPRILVNVLNAYVNQTGVRLTLSDNTETATLTARTGESKGAYTGEAFFTVGNTTYADGKYTVTLTAVGESVINVDLFKKYVRINNNNTKVAPNVEIEDNGDKTYTIVFDYGKMTAPETQADN